MKLRIGLASLAVTALLGCPPLAVAQVTIGVVASSTGPTALVGIPQKNTVPLLPTHAGDVDISYVTLDDASDPAQTITAFKKLIDQDHVDAIIGPSGTPNAMGVLSLVAQSGTPMLAPVGGASVVLPMTDEKKWVFKTTQNTDIIANALVEDMVRRGIKTVGFIGFSDAYGDDWAHVFSGLAKEKGLNIIASERYQRTDNSVTGQALKLLAARPDAVLVAGTGGAAALPQITLRQQGYTGYFYQTHGAALPAFLKLGSKNVEGTILAASLMLVLPEIPDDNASKAIAQDYIQRYKDRYGERPATFGANVYDAGLLLQHAIPEAEKAAKPETADFRKALREALERTRDLVATQGVYNMTPDDHSGFDDRGRVLITVKNGEWALLRTPE